MEIERPAPAKINLALHVTGQRPDGYHELDSLVAFADIGDVVRVSRATQMSIRVQGPFARGVPVDESNLCWRAAALFGETVRIELTKNLPAGAGIGGGSSDAAAVLRAMESLYARPFTKDASQLGADIPVCLSATASRMSGIGETVTPTKIPPLAALLVNPGHHLATPDVFRALTEKSNPPLDWPPRGDLTGLLSWLQGQRNDLQDPATSLCPQISEVCAALSEHPAVRLVRMSGSGTTCFALFNSRSEAEAAKNVYSRRHPEHWSQVCTLS